MRIELREGERLDDLERNGLRIIQNPDLFCFGMDAVLLSGFAEVHPGENVMDLGTGNGILPLLLSAKTKGKHFTGLEIQAESTDLARRSVELNDLLERIEILQGNLKEASERFGRGSFDVVTSNPPYLIEGAALKNPDDAKAIARHEICCTLRDVVRESGALLRDGGRLYLVHRPFRLTDLMNLMREYAVEPKRLRFVHPFFDKEPSLILIEGRKNGHSGLRVEPPLIIYREKDVYTEEVDQLYRF